MLDRDTNYYHYSRVNLLPWIQSVFPFQGRALDVGYAAGLMGQALLNSGFDEVWGVETVESAWREASGRLTVAIHGHYPCPEVAAGGPFSAMFFMDSLEHMCDPWRALDEAAEILEPGGHLVMSVPNVSNYDILRRLLRGSWEYEDAGGLLDRGHMRFFTPSSLTASLSRAGFLTIAERDLLSQPRWFYGPLTFAARSLAPHLLVYQMLRIAIRRK